MLFLLFNHTFSADVTRKWLMHKKLVKAFFRFYECRVVTSEMMRTQHPSQRMKLVLQRWYPMIQITKSRRVPLLMSIYENKIKTGEIRKTRNHCQKIEQPSVVKGKKNQVGSQIRRKNWRDQLQIWWTK